MEIKNKFIDKEISGNRSIFVIGDSVSIHYGPYLKQMVKGKFNYDRKRGMNEALVDLDKPIGANGGDSSMVLKYLKEEKLKQTKYDILVINCGLHDIRVDRDSSKNQINQHEYEVNLNEIINIAESLSNKIIWVETTPFIDKVHNLRKEGLLRYNKDLQVYNKVAKDVMSNRKIAFIKLYNFTKSLGENIYCDHVHFIEEVRALQAAFISGYLNSLI